MNLHVDFTKPVDGEVIFVDSLRRFWFRPWSWEDCLLTVSSSMETSSSLWPVATLINKETFYCAKFSEDQLYYRCRILDVKGDNVDVEYIDYKNTETKLKTEILDLPAELQKIQPLVMNLKTKLNKYANNEKNKLALEDYLFGEGLSLAIDDGVVQEYYINEEKAKLKKVLEKKEEGVTSPTRPIKEKEIVTPSTKSSKEEEGVASSPSVEKVTPATSAKKENEGVASSNKPRKGDSTTRNENEESSSNLDPREEKIAKLVQKESIETLGKSPILKEKSKVDIIAKETIAVSAEKPKASSDTGGGSLTKAKTPVRTTEKGLPLFVKLDGTVVFVEDVKTVWFTQDIFADAINDLMDKLAVAGPTLPPAEDINLEHSYATTFSEDDGYYRCRVLEMTEDGKVCVQFIDYGNIEGKEKKDILALTPDLKKMMPAAIKVPVFDTVNVENSKCNYELLNDALVGQQVQISMEVVDGVKLGKIFIDNKRLELKFDSGIQEALERHLPTGVKIPGTVVFIENINEIFFTQSSEMSTLEEVMESLASLRPTFYKVDEPKVGELYGCIFSEDENLYRCKVLSQEDDGFKVQFVDYGNSEVKKMGDFLSLPTNLKEPLPFAIKLKTSIKNKESILESLEAELMYSDLEVIIDSEGFATFERAGIQLVSSAPPSQTKDNIMVESKDAPVYTESPLPIGIKVPVLLGDLNSVHIIWISLGEVEGFLDEEKNGAVVQAILEDESCLDAANMGQLVPQQVYVARFKVDNLLYRARVLEVKSDGTAEVVFIDFGNTDVCSEFYHLRDELSGIPPAAHRVQIITNSGVEDSIDNRDKLRGILDTADLEVVLEKSETGYLGRVFVNGSELDTGDLTQASDLQKEICLRLDQMTPTANNNLDNSSGFEVGVAVEVSVPHVETAEEVMVQRLPNLGLDNLMCNLEALNETGTLKVEQCPKLNGVYIARFSEDDGLYRGRVEELNGDQVKIRFIDYGNTENKTAGELLEMPLDMAKVPPFAIRVRIRCLLGVEHSQGNMDLLDQMLMQDGIVLTLESESTGDFTIGGQPIDVSLFKKKALPSIPAMPVAKECSTKDIAEPLPKECARTDFDKHVAHKVIVSHVESVEDVMVQMVSNQGGLDELMDSLDALDAAGNPKPAQQPKLNALYIARFSEDDCLYRGRVEELNGDLCKIRFVDYGNAENKSVGELLEMPREMSNIPPFATSVKVQSLIGFDNSEENRILLILLVEGDVSLTLINENAGEFTIGGQPIDVSIFKKEEAAKPKNQLEPKETPNPKKLDQPQPKEETSNPKKVNQPEPQKEIAKPKKVDQPEPKKETPKPKKVDQPEPMKATPKPKTVDQPEPKKETAHPKEVAQPILEKVIVSHVESVEDVMVQMVSNQGGLDELMDSLDALDAAGNPKPALRPQLNALYIARFSEDNSLYRGRVEELNGDQCKIRFIDYGNMEHKSVGELLEMPREMSNIPPFATSVKVECLIGFDNIEENRILLDTMLLEDEVSVTRISANVGVFTIGDQPIDVSLFKKTIKPNVVAQPKKETVKPKEVALSGPKKDITAKPKEDATVHVKAAEKAPTTSLAKPSTPTRTIKDLEMAASGELEVYLVSIESVSKIWVNIAQYQDALEEMMEKLQNCPDLVPLQHCSTGANAICRYSDGDLYRVRVFAVKGDKVHLIYLDYGNKEWTSPADLMEIPEEFCEIPALALQLTVKSLPIEDTLQHQDIVLKVLEEQPSFKVKYRVQGNQVQCKLPKPLSADVLEQVEAKRAIWMDPVETKKAPYGAATAGVNKVIQLSPEKLRQAEVEVSQPRIPSTDSESGRVVSGELTTSVLDALTNPATRSLGISNLQGMSVPLTLERALEMKLVKESDVLNLEPEKGGGDAPVQKSSSVSQAAKIASNREDSIRGDAEKIRSVRPRTNPAEAQPTLVSGEIARLNISNPGATRPSTPKVSRPMTPEGLEEENSGPTPQKVSRPNRPEESRPIQNEVSRPIQTEVSRPALSAFPKAIEADRMPGWARGEKVLGYWSKDNQWRNAVIIDINQDEAMIACTSDPDVETITVPLGHIKSNSMPLTSLNIMENQIAEQQKRNEPPRTMNPDSPVFAPKTSRIAPLNRGNNNITTNRGYNNNTIPFQFNNNNSSLPFTINANVSNVGIAALSPEEPKKLSFIQVETSMYSSSELSSLAKTLSGSTKLQSELTSRTNPALTKQILNIVLQSPVEFINHHRATYLVQTLAGVLSSSDLCVLSEVVSQHFTVIATSKAGTHLAQTLASNKNRIVAKVMSRSLMSIKNLPRFLNDINGSYVAQVCLNETTDKDTFMFLVAGILPDLASICCGAHSTFFIQKLIPFAKSMGFADLNLIVKGVINNIGLLAFNPNGTRIVQAAVGVCSESQMEKMALWLKADLRIVYKSREAVYVAQEILDQIINRTGEDKWTNILLGIVNVLLNDTEDGRPLLICAALSMSGSKICLQLFKIIRGPIKADIMALVSKYHQELAASVNGAVIIKALN